MSVAMVNGTLMKTENVSCECYVKMISLCWSFGSTCCGLVKLLSPHLCEVLVICLQKVVLCAVHFVEVLVTPAIQWPGH